MKAHAEVIFQLPIEKVPIETLFSIMNYDKDKNRLRLNEETVASTIHGRDTKNRFDIEHEFFSQEDIAFDADRVSLHKLLW